MTDRDLRALSVHCPLCSAFPQQLCRDERGNKMVVPHVARLDAYDREKQKSAWEEMYEGLDG